MPTRHIVAAYTDESGKEVPEHIISVPTADEIKIQGDLNIANTAGAVRRKVLAENVNRNGDLEIKDGLGL